MLDKVKFWKRKEFEPEIEETPIEETKELQSDSEIQNSKSLETEPSPGIPEFGTGMQQENTQPTETEKPNLELINTKLDAIKSELDNVNLRIKNIEKIAQAEEKKQKI